MAGRLLPPGAAIYDVNGDPVSGAKVYVYVNDTTTPQATYTAIGLGTPNAWPVVADSAGRLPPMFVADKTFYRVKITDASDIQILQQDDCPALGQDWTTLSYDFSPHGRYRVIGVGGYIHIETGDSDGDDVGGTARMGGWNSTQGDVLTLDYADLVTTGDFSVAGDATVEGVLKVQGGRDIGLIAWQTGTLTAASLLELTFPVGYSRFRLELTQIAFSADCDLVMSGFISGAYHTGPTIMASAAASSGSDANWASLELWWVNAGVMGFVHFYNQSAGYTATTINDQNSIPPTGPASKIRLKPSVGTFSGNYALYVYKGLTG